MGQNQHVVPHNEKWAVRCANNSKATVVTPTQTSAIKIARKIAINQGAEVVIHGQNGKIRDSDSYGNDPSSIRDKVH
jgi:threonine dehydratase